MNSQIDIIVPWVNPSDKKWVEEFSKYKEKETGDKSDQRFRDMDTFKYWFRCIEKNCDWYRYIFLVLSSPSQIPNWLNTNHPKLKIVFHKDFIPENLLPTFNSSTIICHFSFIKELSENFILFNDDMFAISKMNESDFFNNDVPVCSYSTRNGYKNPGPTSWYKNIENNNLFVEKNFGRTVHYRPAHGIISYDKKIQLFLWEKFGKFFKEAFSESKFRKDKNITDWLFFDIQIQILKIQNANKQITQYINKPSFSEPSKTIVCFNDNENLNETSYKEFKKSVLSFFENKFKEKSKFEK